MKKLMIAVAALFAAAVPMKSFAADNLVDVTVGYGGYTAMDAISNYHDDWHSVNTAWGSVNATVWFNAMPKLAFGPSYSISSATTDGGKNHSTLLYNTILGNVKYEFFKNSIVKLYAHAGAGVEITRFKPKNFDSYNKSYFAFQVSPIGAIVDLTPNFGLFGEAGFGSQGLVQAGVKFSF